MIPQAKFAWLMTGIIAILAVATIIGWLLQRRVGSGNTNAVIENLNARIRAWWVMVAVLGAGFLVGPTATVVLFAFASAFALREFITLTPTRRADHLSLVTCFYLILPLQYWLIGTGWYGLSSIFIPVYGLLTLPVVAAFSGDTVAFLERVTKIQWGVMITVYCISYAPALIFLEIGGYEGQSMLLLIYLLLVVQISDVLQYVFGKLFGRRKIAPHLSPSKTWEGLFGGGTSAMIIGTALWWVTPFSPLQACGMASVIIVTGFLGGLALSAVKRSLGAKDWGTIIEGHGGMLDRLDSVSFSAPIFFHLCRYFFTP